MGEEGNVPEVFKKKQNKLRFFEAPSGFALEAGNGFKTTEID